MCIVFLMFQAWQKDYKQETNFSDTDYVVGQSYKGDDVINVPKHLLPSKENDNIDLLFHSDVDLSRYVNVDIDTLRVSISLRGGDIRRIALPTYPISIEDEKPIQLLWDKDDIYFAQSGLVAAQSDSNILNNAPDHYALYKADKYRYSSEDIVDGKIYVPLEWNHNGLKIIKRFVFFPGEFYFDVQFDIFNNSDSVWIGSQYNQIRHGPKIESDNKFVKTFSGFAYYDGGFHKLKFGNVEKNSITDSITNGWIAALQHYFISAWIPLDDENYHYYTKTISGYNDHENYIIGFLSDPYEVKPGAELLNIGARFYAGAKDQEKLYSIAEGLELTVDYGVFSFIAKPLFYLLNFFYSITRNWGFAIILVTLLIKLFFYYPSKISYQSMAKMRAMQPKMQEIKNRFGDNKQQMNEALMNLYRKEKINPFGGCLPILIQIPVFIALYWVLIESVELRQAPFVFWIKDLSIQDPYYVLPLIMGASMFVQQHLNPAPLDPIQQKIMLILPVMFTVFFMFFPAGLVLYWVVNNLLSIAQQWVITKKVERDAL